MDVLAEDKEALQQRSLRRLRGLAARQRACSRPWMRKSKICGLMRRKNSQILGLEGLSMHSL